MQLELAKGEIRGLGLRDYILLSITDFCICFLGLKKQFLPKLDELNSKCIKDLLKRFGKCSKKRVLTYLLEWQDRNITFWHDRMYYVSILYILLIAIVLLLPANDMIKFTLFSLSFLMWIVNFTLLLSYSIALIAAILLSIVWLFSINPLHAQKFYSVFQLVLLSSIFGALIALIAYLSLKYSALKSRIPKFRLKDTLDFLKTLMMLLRIGK